MRTRNGQRNWKRGGFTLIEILIVVTILGTLAGIVVPSFVSLGNDSGQASLKGQLQRLRGQIELFRAENGNDPALVASQWTEMTPTYMRGQPRNPLNDSQVVAAAPGPGVGWIWRDKGNGSMMLFATDETHLAEYLE